MRRRLPLSGLAQQAARRSARPARKAGGAASVSSTSCCPAPFCHLGCASALPRHATIRWERRPQQRILLPFKTDYKRACGLRDVGSVPRRASEGGRNFATACLLISDESRFGSIPNIGPFRSRRRPLSKNSESLEPPAFGCAFWRLRPTGGCLSPQSAQAIGQSVSALSRLQIPQTRKMRKPEGLSTSCRFENA
jgi:hypothetical protein